MPTRPASEPLLVRVDPDTRYQLKKIADSSDRTMSQLVRYATTWWTSMPTRLSAVAGGDGVNRSEFINVRFAPEEMALVREAACDMGLERGAVIWCAVRAWLAAGDFTALGDPRRVTGAPEQSDTQPIAV